MNKFSWDKATERVIEKNKEFLLALEKRKRTGSLKKISIISAGNHNFLEMEVKNLVK